MVDLFREQYESYLYLLNQIGEAKDAGDFLYHYTSQRTFLDIIKSDMLWMSNIHSMNDPLEVKYGLEIIQKFAEINRNVDIADILSENQKNPYSAPEKYQSYSRPTFVFSFTTNRDKLGDWKKYGDDGKGVSMVFVKEKILPFLQEIIEDQVFCLLVPVFYVKAHSPIENDANMALNVFLKHYFDTNTLILKNCKIDGESFNIRRMIYENILSIASMIKHPFHEEENEWRLVIVADGPGVKDNIDILCENGLKMIYKLNLKVEKSENEKAIASKNISQILHEIVLGPKVKSANVREAIYYLLFKYCSDQIGIWPSEGTIA